MLDLQHLEPGCEVGVMAVPRIDRHRERANYWFRVLHLIQVLVWVTLDHAGLILIELAFRLVRIHCVG